MKNKTKNLINLSEIRKNHEILEFIKLSDQSLAASGYTDHGLNHLNLVAVRARNIAKEIGLSDREQELVSIAGFCHDMGNFLSRTNHHYLGAMLFHQALREFFSPKESCLVMQAISNHDKMQDINFSNKISAVLVLADKSDVRRTRVLIKDIDEIKADIHSRVNFATRSSKIKTNKRNRTISLMLKIDTTFVPVMEYFEIFTDRMVYCREAANYLGYKFELVINNFKLL